MARRRAQRRGQLIRKGPSWLLRWWEDVRCADGTVRRVRFGQVIASAGGPGAVSKRQAQRTAWDEVLSKLDQASIAPGSLLTLKEFVELKFRKHVIEKKRKSGQIHYATWLDGHVLPALGHLRMREFKLETVQDFLDSKAKETHAPMRTIREGDQIKKVPCGPPRPYSVQSLIHIRNALSRVFRKARESGYYPATCALPTEGVELPELVRAERGSLSAAQARDFLAAAESPLRVLLLTLLVCGLRISEACGLRWRDVDFEARLVRKRFAWKFGAYQEMKSKASRKDIPLPDELLAVLAQLKARTRWDGPDHPVFASRTGRPLDQKNLLNRKLKPIARRLGLPMVSWHWFRHTASTQLANEGAQPQDRRALLGHTDDETNLIYTHSDPERIRLAMSRFASSLLKAPEETGVVQ